MTETQTYSIAGHTVRADYTCVPRKAAEIVPSFQPFLAGNAEGDAVLHITVDDRYRPGMEELHLIKQFPSADYEYRLFGREDKSLVVAFCGYDHKPMAVIDMAPGFRKSRIAVLPQDGRYASALSNAIMISYAFATSHLATVAVHSSTVLYKGKGYMFLGKSGTGKSTHSQSWLRNFGGCELMNDDNPIMRVIGGRVMVYGSPWSGKTSCYKQLCAPVGAMVALVQAKHNKIARLGNVKAFANVFSAASTLLCHKDSFEAILETMLRIAGIVPVYELENLPDDDAAKLCNSTIVCR